MKIIHSAYHNEKSIGTENSAFKLNIMQCNIISKKSIRRNKILIANRNSRVKFKLKILRENEFFFI